MASTVIKILVLLFLAAFPVEANAVTNKSVMVKTDDVGAVTATTIQRAEADVQIRRIKNMIANNKVDGDEAFERLEALHLKLRGSK